MKKQPAKKAPSRSHPTLGRFTYEEAYDWWKGCVEIKPGHKIDFCLSTWGTHGLTTLELFDRGADFLTWARRSLPVVLDRIGDGLLTVYRDNWAPEVKRTSRPMPRKVFLSHITTSMINLNADGSAFWYFTDGGLFAGHSIEVGVQPDRSLSETSLAG